MCRRWRSDGGLAAAMSIPWRAPARLPPAPGRLTWVPRRSPLAPSRNPPLPRTPASHRRCPGWHANLTGSAAASNCAGWYPRNVTRGHAAGPFGIKGLDRRGRAAAGYSPINREAGQPGKVGRVGRGADQPVPGTRQRGRGLHEPRRGVEQIGRDEPGDHHGKNVPSYHSRHERRLCRAVLPG